MIVANELQSSPIRTDLIVILQEQLVNIRFTGPRFINYALRDSFVGLL